MISSPCTNICVMDAGLCIGCGRTLNEVATWGGLSEQQRRAIMDTLPARLAGSDLPDQADRKTQTDQHEKKTEGHLKLPPRP